MVVKKRARTLIPRRRRRQRTSEPAFFLSRPLGSVPAPARRASVQGYSPKARFWGGMVGAVSVNTARCRVTVSGRQKPPLPRQKQRPRLLPPGRGRVCTKADHPHQPGPPAHARINAARWRLHRRGHLRHRGAENGHHDRSHLRLRGHQRGDSALVDVSGARAVGNEAQVGGRPRVRRTRGARLLPVLLRGSVRAGQPPAIGGGSVEKGAQLVEAPAGHQAVAIGPVLQRRVRGQLLAEDRHHRFRVAELRQEAELGVSLGSEHP